MCIHIDSGGARNFFRRGQAKYKIKKKFNLKNNMGTCAHTHIYTWNVCNFDLTYDIFLT